MDIGPDRQHMQAVYAAFDGPGFVMKTKPSGCCRCCCCRPNRECTVHDFRDEPKLDDSLAVKYSLIESATQCGRTCAFCAPGSRAITYRLYEGDVAPSDSQSLINKPVLLTHEKNATCCSNLFIILGQNGNQVRIPCCCNLPYLITKDANGQVLGTTKQVCNPCCCVYKYALEKPNGERKYYLLPNTCCCGCCLECYCDGSSAAIPYDIRHLDDSKIEDAKIQLRWLHYFIKYPQNADFATRATLQGAALLLDMTVYEQ